MNERRGAFPSGLQFTLRNKQLSFTNVNMSAHSHMRNTSRSDLELQHRSRKVVRKHFKPRLTSELQRTTVSSTLKPDLEEVKEPNKTATNQLQRCCKLKKWWHIDRHSEKCGKLSTCQRTRVEQSCCSSTLEGARGGCSESSMWTPPCTPPCTLRLLIRKTPGRRCDASSPWTHAQDAAGNQP